MNNQEMLEKLAEAEMVLVGLGEEFDNKRILQGNPEYVFGAEQLKENNLHWNISCDYIYYGSSNAWMVYL